MALKKFEHFLAAHRRPEWRYIAYDVLKQLLRSHPSAFLDTLWREIAEVDAFFQRLNYGMEAESKHLATFALLNHLAVKRILQKHAKHSSCKRDSPNAEEFCGKLCESVLFMSKAATLESDDQASEVAKILRDVALDCRVSDKEEGHEANAFAIGETDLRHVNASYVQISGVPESEPQHVNIMTWNTCAISFPLHIPSAKFLMGLFFLGCWWHDSRHDAPMQIHSVLAQQRFAKQADYIRHSGADLILLQEMLSTSMLDSLMLHLADEFDFAYMRCSPRFGAFILWTLFLLLVAFGQCLCIQLLIVLPCSQFSHSLPASWCWLLICPLFTSLVLRWRHSVPAHFLFGDVAGQLVVLRRKSCLALTGDGFFAESFETFGSFEATSDVASIETPSWLSVFFNVRLRGVLRVSVPLTLSKCRGKLTLLNTHLPHQTDNAKLLQSLGSYAAKFTSKSAVVLAGDFNPLPDLGLSRQLEPLVQSGLVATDGLLEQNCTWDLQQSLTRRNSNTPRSMQLDFIFLQNQRDGDFPEPDKGLSTRLLDEIDLDIEANCSRTLEMKVLSTAVVDPEKFLTAPLSDHYGLLSQVELAWHM